MVNYKSRLSIAEEISTTPPTDSAQAQQAADRWHGDVAKTLGSSSQLIIITALEYKTGATSVTGTINLIAAIVNADPPTELTPKIIAFSEKHTPGATSTTYKVSIQSATPFQGGQIIKPFLNQSGTPYTRYSVVSSAFHSFAETYSVSPARERTVSWINATQAPYIKIYYKVIG